MKQILTLNLGTKLYRADEVQPPNYWSKEHSDQTQYGKMSETLGKKNQGDFFFFHDAKIMSTNYASELFSSNKLKDRTYYLTSCETAAPCSIIDFSNCDNIYHMLEDLDALGVNVLVEDFLTYEETNEPFKVNFSVMNDSFRAVKNGDKFSVYKVCTPKIKLQNFSLFGQRLTDFHNGTKFKKLVLESNQNLVGYRWREHNDPNGFTYCFFDHKMLSKPKTEVIIIPKK